MTDRTTNGRTDEQQSSDGTLKSIIEIHSMITILKHHCHWYCNNCPIEANNNCVIQYCITIITVPKQVHGHIQVIFLKTCFESVSLYKHV